MHDAQMVATGHPHDLMERTAEDGLGARETKMGVLSREVARSHEIAGELREQVSSLKAKLLGEEHHIEPLMTKLRTAEAALAHMVVVLDKIHRDCE